MNLDDSARGRSAKTPGVVPVFPLPDHVLLPAMPAPYRIFEPRYRAMIEHLLTLPDDDRWLAVPRLAPGWQADYEGKPEFLPVATVAPLVKCSQNPDGTYQIVVGEGVRCRLEEIDSDRPFRLARAVPLDDGADAGAAPGELAASMDALLQVVGALAVALGPAARGLAAIAQEKCDPPRKLFRLGTVLVQHPDRRYEFLSECDPARRVDQLLEAAATLLGLAGARGGTLEVS